MRRPGATSSRQSRSRQDVTRPLKASKRPRVGPECVPGWNPTGFPGVRQGISRSCRSPPAAPRPLEFVGRLNSRVGTSPAREYAHRVSFRLFAAPLAFTADGKRLVTSGGGVWDTRTAERVGSIAWSERLDRPPAGTQFPRAFSTTADRGGRRCHRGRMAATIGNRRFTQGAPAGPEGIGARNDSREEWCPGRDLNPDELPHTPLKRTRIPIPPPGQGARLRLGPMDPEGLEVVVPRTGLEPIRPCGH